VEGLRTIAQENAVWTIAPEGAWQMNYRRAVVSGLGVWAIPFVVAMGIFPLRESERPLFESLMAVAVVGAATLFAYRYARTEPGFARQGLALGLVFLAVSVVIDLLLFSWGPMKMGLVEYAKDIGVTYLALPIITYGMSRVVRAA
jgi:ABC-type tungstate transport system substrate-binding protein